MLTRAQAVTSILPSNDDVKGMAPSKKKPGKSSPKSQPAPTVDTVSTITGPDADSPTPSQPLEPQPRGALSSGRPRKQALIPHAPLPPMQRPKRNAEKKFYDDIEDERPQHLIKRKKNIRGLYLLLFSFRGSTWRFVSHEAGAVFNRRVNISVYARQNCLYCSFVLYESHTTVTV